VTVNTPFAEEEGTVMLGGGAGGGMVMGGTFFAFCANAPIAGMRMPARTMVRILEGFMIILLGMLPGLRIGLKIEENLGVTFSGIDSAKCMPRLSDPLRP
jgi:hypothetical protein